MKRQWPREIGYAQDGPNGRPAKEIVHRWISKQKRRTHKRERAQGKREAASS